VARTHRIPGLVLTEHEVPVPLDHDRPDGERIVVFAREVADPDGHNGLRADGKRVLGRLIDLARGRA
jgi:hypothetical protein